ncbi:MAG: S-layer homology domain-containing protein, partial [Acidimicrobiia bacterium]
MKGDIVRRRVFVSIALAVVMALGVTASAELAGHVFPDVPDDHVFANGIEWAKDNGLVVGYDNGNFGPADPVTRGQMVTIMKRYHDQLGGTGGATGAVGPVGPAGPQGEPGITLVATRLTDPNPAFGGVRVVDVPGEGTGSNNFTVDLFPSVTLEEGTYYVESTVQFFDFTGTTGEGPEYGLARSFLDG